MEHILKSYQRRLINLSSGNRALLLRRLNSGLQLDLAAFDFINGQPAFNLLRELLAGKKEINLAPFADSRQKDVAPLSRQLKMLRRKTEMLLEERGTQELFVGWPFVSGKLNDGNLVRCPLLFFPVFLELNGKQEWVLRQQKTAPPMLNKSFLLAYAHYNQTQPDEYLLDLELSDFPTDILAFRTALYELLKASNLEINFNQELFQDKMIPFRSFTKSDLEAQFKAGELKLFPEAVLGVFPQAGSYLMSDYDKMLQEPALLSFEDLFKIKAGGRTFAENLEQNTFAVFDLDASQEKILQEVKSGNSVVVQGPPGTGKSQLICNMVTDFLARGKTVWVICQKRAALDVVYNRLATKGFGNFVSLVHDVEIDRSRIFSQLRLQIDEVETYKKLNNQLPIIFAERQFLETSRRINHIIQQLAEFKNALFDASVCGWSAKELYLKSSLQAATIPLPDSRVFMAETLPFFLPKLKRFLEAAEQFDASEFLLAERKSFANYSWPERKKLEELVVEIPEKLRQFFTALPVEIQAQTDLASAWKLLKTDKAELENLADLQSAKEAFFIAFQILFSKTAAERGNFLKALKQLEEFYQAETVYLTLEELESAFSVLETYKKSQENFWQQTKWQLNSGAKKDFNKLLNRFQLPFSEAGYLALKTKLAHQKSALQNLNYLKAIINNVALHFSENPHERERQFSALKDAVAGVQLAKKLVRKKWLNGDMQTVGFQVKKLLAALEKIENKSAGWQKYLTGNQIEKLATDESFTKQFLEIIQQHFEAISTHDSRFSEFSEAEKTVAKTLQKVPGTVENKLVSFQNSVYLNWIVELEEKFPVLKLAGPELNKLETELQELILQKQKLSHEIVLTCLREKTYRSLEKNRLGNTVSYRKLYAQVSKKRQLFPLRKLQANFGEEINDLVPCWLASPETISAIFPLSQRPDLVIFDEASQAFAETGLPAIFRAKQVVIAGDENQLAPTDLYRSRWQDEDTETEELFVESLLQLGSLHLPQHWLTQHYRSRFPELIQFSNQHFYRNKLQLIPDRQDMEKSIPAIEFIKTNGIWENQTNRREAEAVTELLLHLLTEGHSDIGIITFNFAQQNLIQDLVEKTVAERNVVLPPSVLIKNIENMQGDEKQIIIFSVTYAKDVNGKFTAQFGSLNQAKGENRLNVAITRAISKSYLVCSLEPEELRVENTKNAGPKLLKAYLQYAKRVSEGQFIWQTDQHLTEIAPEYLKDKLLEAQKTVGNLSKKVPFADLVLSRGNNFCHLFRTDDELYFGQISARQTHFDVPFLLQKRNWPYTNFYSRQFWLQPQKAVHEMQRS